MQATLAHQPSNGCSGQCTDWDPVCGKAWSSARGIHRGNLISVLVQERLSVDSG